MKKLIVLAGLALSLAANGYEEFRTYSMLDGTSLNAAVISCRSVEDAVELVTLDGTLVKAPKTMFAENDQAYLTDWEMRELFMSPTDFVIIPTRWTHRQWIGEDAGAVPVDDDFSLASGSSEYQYCLTLYNLGGVPLENLTVDYSISYRDYKESSNSAFHSLIRDSDDAEPAAVVTCTVDGKVQVPKLDAGKWKMYTTESVALADINSATSSSGIHVTVQMETPLGRILSREIALPHS